MAKITALPLEETPDGSETVVLVKDGATKRATLASLVEPTVLPLVERAESASDTVARMPAKRLPQRTRALEFLDKRRRLFAWVSEGGGFWNLGGNIVERIAGATRLRSAKAAIGIDLRDDGVVDMAGSHWRAFGTGGMLRATIGQRRRVVEKLTTSSYSVHGFKVQRSEDYLDLTLDGHRFARLTAEGELIMEVGGSPSPVIAKGDTYSAAHGIAPALTNMQAWAAWGSSSVLYLHDNLTGVAAQYGASFYPGGQGGERVEHHTARLGSRPALLTFPDGAIPAGTDAVTLPLPSNWTTVNSLKGYAVTVAGVAGTLTNVSGALTWTRAAAGDEVEVAADTPAIPVDGTAQRGNFTILNMGKNSLTANSTTPAEVAQITADAYKWLSPLVRRCLAINHFTNSNMAPGDAAFNRVLACNAALAAFFGQQLVDQYGFICEGKAVGDLLNCPITDPAITSLTVWDVVGAAPTEAEETAQADGLLPQGTLARDDLHLSEAGDTAMAWLIEKWAQALGYLEAGKSA